MLEHSSINSNFISTQRKDPTLMQQEKTARDLSAKFLERVLKPIFEKSSLFGGDNALGNGATSDNLIKPMFVQNLTSAIAKQGNAMGLYPVFLKAVQKTVQAKETKK